MEVLRQCLCRSRVLAIVRPRYDNALAARPDIAIADLASNCWCLPPAWCWTTTELANLGPNVGSNVAGRRGLGRRRGPFGLAAAAAVCVSLLSCSSPPGAHGSASITPVRTTMGTSAGVTAPATGEPAVSLGCADAAAAGVAPAAADLTVDGLSFSGVPATGPAAPGTTRIDGTSGSYLFRKVFLYVSVAAAATTTLDVVAPPDAMLYYVPGDVWMSNTPADDVITGARRRVTFARCTTALTGYFGGVLTRTGECVTVFVTGAGQRHTVKIPVSAATC